MLEIQTDKERLCSEVVAGHFNLGPPLFLRAEAPKCPFILHFLLCPIVKNPSLWPEYRAAVNSARCCAVLLHQKQG